MENDKYSVRPFEHKNYTRNTEKCHEDETPCAICGKPVKRPWPHTAVVIDGGSEWGDENSDVNDAGYMGAYPVGNACHKKYVVK